MTSTRPRDTEDTWKEQPIVGEIVNRAPTVKEMKFARLVNDGVDPVAAIRTVSSVGSHKGVENRKKQHRAANELLVVCQEKMLLDLTAMAPKALGKLEALLEAKVVKYDKFGDEHINPDNKTQLGAAKELVKLAMPGGSKGNTLSLVNSVIHITQEGE